MSTGASYFATYTKRLEGDRLRMTELVYRHRWKLLGGALEVLDVGFGGGLLMDLAPPGARVRGLDSDPNAVASRPGSAVLGDAEKMPFGDDQFDAVHASHVIEHLEYPEHFVAEAARVLVPHGRLLVATPDIERYRFEFWVDHTHRRPFTRRSLVQLLAMYDLETVRLERGIASQTRLEELGARLGLSVERRYSLRARLGPWLGREIVALARLRG
jgi:SAM-dependent methyltransferase